MIKNVRKRSLVAAAALFLVAGPFTGTAVGQDSELDLRDAGQPARVQAASTDADLDALTLPILSEQMARLASDLMETFGEDPNFASAEVTRDRSSLIVHWHGSPSSEVLAGLDPLGSRSPSRAERQSLPRGRGGQRMNPPVPVAPSPRWSPPPVRDAQFRQRVAV